MARSIFEPGFFTPHPAIGISLKDIESKVTGLIPGSTPTTTPVKAPPPPAAQNTFLGMPPLAAALGGVSILGITAALVFGHK